MSDLLTDKCPRCSGDDSTSTTGYIDWDDATPEEQAGLEADGDNEIHCPLCEPHGAGGMVPEEVALKWLRVHGPSNAPPAKFRLQWADGEEAAHIVATVKFEDEDAVPKERTFIIGLLSFHGNGWDFVRINHDGTQLSDGVIHIECGPDEEARFRKLEEEVRTNNKAGSVRNAQLKAIETQRSIYRSETRELAELGARVEARRWWRVYGDILSTDL